MLVDVVLPAESRGVLRRTSCGQRLYAVFNIPKELMGDSAKMNMWLHKTVLARIAANGGNVPKELLD